MNKKNTFHVTLFLAFFLNVNAQQGPVVECNYCEGTINTPLPANGSWYNPDQSGSGYVLEVQNDRLLAYYFGYDENGDPDWLIMQGQLERGEPETDVLWQVEANFTSFRDGNAFNAPHQFPNVETSGDRVKFEFTAKNYARVTVNDGPPQNFTTIVYGVEIVKEFDESDHFFPNLEGLWNFTFKINRPEVVIQKALYSSDTYHLFKRESYVEEGTKFVEYDIWQYLLIEALPGGKLSCSNPINEETKQRSVICELTRFPDSFLGSTYSFERMIIPIGDIGESSFTAEYLNPGDEFDNLTINAQRVNYIGFEE